MQLSVIGYFDLIPIKLDSAHEPLLDFYRQFKGMVSVDLKTLL